MLPFLPIPYNPHISLCKRLASQIVSPHRTFGNPSQLELLCVTQEHEVRARADSVANNLP